MCFILYDVSIDESARTGESLPVEKTMAGDMHLFQGTMMVGGSGQLLVEATGNRTELAKLGKSIDQIDPAPTPLQIQIRRFVKQMGWIGGGAFVLVFAGRPPMMTHVWENAEKTRIVACKGGLERILAICKLPQERQKELNEQARTMAAKGFRVLAIASAVHPGADFPALQDDFTW